MERRDFIRAAILGSLATATGIKSAAAGTAAGSSAAAGTASGLDEAEAFADASNQLVAVMGGTPEAMYKKGIAEMGGIKRFISKGAGIDTKNIESIVLDRFPGIREMIYNYFLDGGEFIYDAPANWAFIPANLTKSMLKRDLELVTK